MTLLYCVYVCVTICTQFCWVSPRSRIDGLSGVPVFGCTDQFPQQLYQFIQEISSSRSLLNVVFFTSSHFGGCVVVSGSNSKLGKNTADQTDVWARCVPWGTSRLDIVCAGECFFPPVCVNIITVWWTAGRLKIYAVILLVERFWSLLHLEHSSASLLPSSEG